MSLDERNGNYTPSHSIIIIIRHCKGFQTINVSSCTNFTALRNVTCLDFISDILDSIQRNLWFESAPCLFLFLSCSYFIVMQRGDEKVKLNFIYPRQELDFCICKTWYIKKFAVNYVTLTVDLLAQLWKPYLSMLWISFETECTNLERPVNYLQSSRKEEIIKLLFNQPFTMV